MSLGENIVKLRTEKGWTQDDLAERVFTSRQSVSKWETNASTPELEKLLRLSELFGVSLDELVKGTKSQNIEKKDDIVITEAKEPVPSTQRTIGLILFGTGIFAVILCTILGGLLTGLLFGLPLLICAIICLIVKKHAALWCGWTIYGIIHIASPYMTGITWKTIFHTWSHILRGGYTVQLIMAWIYFLFLVLMIASTILSCRNITMANTKKNKILLITGWTIWGLLGIISFIVENTEWYRAYYMKLYYTRNNLIQIMIQIKDTVRLVLFIILLVYTRAFLKTKKNTN